MRIIYSLLIVSLVMLLTIHQTLKAQTPRTLSYQGVLTDSLGNQKPDGMYTFTFRLYDVSTGGSAIWTEIKDVSVKRGLFSTILGDQTSFEPSVKFDRQYWLGIIPGTEPELPQRIALTSVGYSIKSINADTAQYAKHYPLQSFVDSARIAGTIPNNSITNAKLMDSSITGEKIAPNQVVKTLNALSEKITLTATGGATISTSGDSIIINAGSGSGTPGVHSIQNTNNTLDIVNPNGPTTTINVKDGIFLPLSGGTLTGAISNTGNPPITMGKGNFGTGNINTGTQAFVAGGNNRARGNYSVVGGGGGSVPFDSNSATGDHSVIAGGRTNSASGVYATIGGGDGNHANGMMSTIAGGQYGNVDYYSFIGGGWGNAATGRMSVVCGGGLNSARGNNSVVIGGGHASGPWTDSSAALGDWSTVLGGYRNIAGGKYSLVAGRRARANHVGTFVWADTTDADFTSTAPHQFLIRASGGVGIGTNSPTQLLQVHDTIYSSLGGFKFPDGTVQTTAAVGSGVYLPLTGGTMSGAIMSNGDPSITMGKGSFGSGNINTGTQAFVAGSNNRARGDYSVVSGGGDSTLSDSNSALGAYSTVSGGYRNLAVNDFAFVGGGQLNRATANHATVGGGVSNNAGAIHATVGGGSLNIASGFSSTVGGGMINRARGQYSVVSGGGGMYSIDSNSAIGDYSAISGGRSNKSSGYTSSVAGGYLNYAEGQYATLGGGLSNLSSGDYATVPGGLNNRASGRYSFAAGRRAKADHTGTFVWADSTNADFASTAPNQFLIRASGGVGIGNSSPAEKLEVTGNIQLTAGSNRYIILPDKTMSLFVGGKPGFQSNYAIQFITDNGSGSGIERLTIQSDKVGIGTTSPSQVLDVNGNARFRSIGSGAYFGVLNRMSDGTLTTASSDERLKQNVRSLEHSLDKVLQLRGVSFTWKTNPEYGTRIGFIAQEFEKVIPDLVFTNEVDGYKGINYAEVSAVLVEAIKELKSENDNLKAHNKQLEARLNKIENLLEENHQNNRNIGEVR